jgi:uncharacterized membrane protein AbrB (regulator of aidB expression)
VPAIAVVQTMRVIILTAALPLLLALTGIAPSQSPGFATAIASPLELTELIAASVAVALLLRLIKFPASWMFGAMIGSSVLHGGAGRGRPAALGARGRAGRDRRADRLALRADEGQNPAQPCQCGAGVVRHRHPISGIFVAMIVLTTQVRFADVVVAFAPGAMDAMLALALTLHIDPIFVGAHHLSRFVFVTIATARHRPSVRTAAGRRDD